jgi:hypothetical protein
MTKFIRHHATVLAFAIFAVVTGVGFHRYTQLNDRIQGTCESRQESRTAIRELILLMIEDNPSPNQDDIIAHMNKGLPPTVNC